MEAAHVARVRVRAVSDASVRRRVFLIEDALRTVRPRTWAPHGMCWIRCLDLGNAPENISAVAFGERVEQRLNQIRPLTVNSAYVDDVNADAVWFSDELAPYRMALQRFVLELPVRAWYWARAIETARRDSAASLPMALLNTLSQGEPGKHALASVISQAVQAQWIDSLLAHITKTDVSAFSPILSARPTESTPQSDAAAKTFSRRFMPSVWQNVFDRWVGRWGREDPRSEWLTRIVHTANGPTTTADQALSAANSHLEIPIEGNTVGRTLTRNVEPNPGRPTTLPRSELTLQPSLVAPPANAVRAERVPDRTDVVTQTTEPNSNEHSHYAGFAFTINLLQRLGLGETLVQHPDLLESNLPIHLLDRLAQRARISNTDPARAWYAHLQCDALETELTTWSPPQRWSTLFPQVVFPPSAIDAFERAAILFLRRHARLGLRRLAYRSGELILTATHFDALFAIERIDIRIRRAGLDFDPGWVPWLKRVVHFHYIEG